MDLDAIRFIHDEFMNEINNSKKVNILQKCFYVFISEGIKNLGLTIELHYDRKTKEIKHATWYIIHDYCHDRLYQVEKTSTSSLMEFLTSIQPTIQQLVYSKQYNRLVHKNDSPLVSLLKNDFYYGLTYTFSHINEDEICCVCLDKTIVRLCTCNHIVCVLCIDKLLEKKCPLCMTPILSIEKCTSCKTYEVEGM